MPFTLYPFKDCIGYIATGDVLDIIKSIEDNSIDVICVDPPYFLTGHSWDKQWKTKEEYLGWCDLWFKECFRVLKTTGAFYTFQDWRLVSNYVIKLQEIFPYFQNWITWERIKGRSSAVNWKSTKEEILYFSKTKHPIFFEQKKLRPVIAPYKNEDGTPKGWFIDEEGNRVRWTGTGNVWHYTPPVFSSKTEKPVHPTQKPVALIERILRAHTEPGYIVLDCFAGSGTTGVAARNLGLDFILIEKEYKYVEKILDRLYP
jgi:site-specific DNA-methyltransferase (adenine-specific)